MFIDWSVVSRPELIEVLYVSIVGLYWSSMTGNDISWGLGLRTLPRIQTHTQTSKHKETSSLAHDAPTRALAGGGLMSGRPCRGQLCWRWSSINTLSGLLA